MSKYLKFQLIILFFSIYTFSISPHCFGNNMNNSEITDNQNLTESKSPNWDLPEHCGILTEQVLFELGWMKDYAKLKVISSNIYMDLVENGVIEFRSQNTLAPFVMSRLYPDLNFVQSICLVGIMNNDYNSTLLSN